MNFNKCKRCCCFFVANGDTCPVCTKKDNSDISTLNSYFAENENTHSISINNLANITGVYTKNLARFVDEKKLDCWKHINL